MEELRREIEASPVVDEARKDEGELPVIEECDDIDLLDRFSPICERDVDLLFRERSSTAIPHFASGSYLFCHCRHNPGIYFSCLAKHSVFASGEAAGESDLEIVFTLGRQRFEVCACPARRQGECAFYTIKWIAMNVELNSLVGRKSNATRCLWPPESLSQPLKCFNVRVRYEDMKEFFVTRAAGELAKIQTRYHHRAALLRKAIEGPIRAVDPERTKFFDDYNEFAVERHPELNRNRRGVVTAIALCSLTS